jgi:hypothetical protein
MEADDVVDERDEELELVGVGELPWGAWDPEDTL